MLISIDNILKLPDNLRWDIVKNICFQWITDVYILGYQVKTFTIALSATQKEEFNAMITIYHNPRCSKSRTTLGLIEDSGTTPTIVDYLKTPPSKAELIDILSKLELGPRDIMRKGEDAYKENQLADTRLSDDALLDAMVKHPKLIERPIVVKGSQAILGRPPENVLALL